MFENSTIFVMLKNKQIQRLRMDDSINSVRFFFAELYEEINACKEQPFQAGYKANEDEINFVDKFALPQNIYKALMDSSSIDSFQTIKDRFAQLDYLFIGEVKEGKALALFQKIRKPKVLQRGLSIFTSADTLWASTDPYFTIEPRLNCVFRKGRLLFSSIYNARQIFDMRNVFIEATDDDLIGFITQNMFACPNQTNIVSIADQNIRRTITIIKNSNMLKQYSAKQIKQIADQIKLPLEIETINGKEKIRIPETKKELSNLLKILEETVFQGVLSNQWLETNSKKQFVP